MNLPLEVQDILKWLKSEGLEARVMGGAARCLAFGVPVNDWDIVVLRGDLDHGTAFELAEEVCRTFHMLHPDSTVAVTQAYEQASGDFDDRWLSLAQLEFHADNVSVDILVAACHTWREVVDGFDSNINQCMLKEDGTPFYYYGERPVDIKFLKPITVARLCRIVDIAGQLGLKCVNKPEISDLDTLPKRDPDPQEDIAW
jgi:hypothetical protein